MYMYVHENTCIQGQAKTSRAATRTFIDFHICILYVFGFANTGTSGVLNDKLAAKLSQEILSLLMTAWCQLRQNDNTMLGKNYRLL